MSKQSKKKDAKVKKREKALTPNPVSGQAIQMICGMRKKRASEPFEDRIAKLTAFLGDGNSLLEEESLEIFASWFKKSRKEFMLESMSVQAAQLAIDNYLQVLSWERDGEAWEIGLMALMRCGVLERAPSRVVDEVFDQSRNALGYGRRSQTQALAREMFNHPVYRDWVEKRPEGAGEVFREAVGSFSLDAIYDNPKRQREKTMGALQELILAAERHPELIAVSGRNLPGAALRSLAAPERGCGGKRAVALRKVLSEAGLRWIQEKRDWPEEGVLSAGVCERLVSAIYNDEEEFADELVSTLKEALAQGSGARVEKGDQPLKILMGADNKPGRLSQALVEAGSCLLGAGAKPEDVTEGIEAILAQAPNQALAMTLKSIMESRAIEESLTAMTAEEWSVVEAFREAKRLKAQPAGTGGARPRRSKAL